MDNAIHIDWTNVFPMLWYFYKMEMTKEKGEYMSQLPKDPVMLLSYVNTQLRDFYDSFEDLCKALDLDENEIKQKLSSIGYEYNDSLNQFK